MPPSSLLSAAARPLIDSNLGQLIPPSRPLILEDELQLRLFNIIYGTEWPLRNDLRRNNFRYSRIKKPLHLNIFGAYFDLMTDNFEAVVVGSGFGGTILALSLANKFAG